MIVSSIVVASAASLGGVTTASLGSGSGTVGRCDTAFTVSYVMENGLVDTVTVSDIADPACEGGEVSLTLVNASGSAIGSAGPATVATDVGTAPNSVTMTVASHPAASGVAGVRVVVVGP